VLAYLHLKEMDINNIITVVEGVRYGVGEDKIRKYINIDMRR
jgi:V/A-type H+-transporting ATPase subunit C